MKKFVNSTAALMLVISLFAGTSPAALAADALNTESGVIDMSGESICVGEFEGMSFDMSYLPEILADSDDYLLGSHLDANNTAVYAAFRKLVNPSISEFTVKLPEAVKFTTDDIESSENNEFFNAVFGSCASGMEAASFDTPLNFWLDQNHTSVSASKMPYTYDRRTKLYTFTLQELTFSPSYYEGFASMDEVMEYKAILEETVANYKIEGETTAEKLRSIHDQIALFTYYDEGGLFSGSALSALVVPGSVCEGYSKGFKLICDSIGVPCVCVFGNYDPEKATAHMWNYVRMEDGYWYAVDATWDDYDGSYDLEFVDTYFLKGSDSFNVKHDPCNDYNLTHFEYPELVSWDYGKKPGDIVTTEAIPVTTTKNSATKPVTTTTKAGTTKKPTTVTTIKTTTLSSSGTRTTATKATTAVITTTVPEIEYGDLNHDGKVSIADLVYCASGVLAIEKNQYSCDINEDGKEDVFDVIIMRKLVVEVVFKTIKAQNIS